MVSEPSGTVLNIQRMSTEDGPGIRTTVFLKGCTLACTWCHNPESIEARSRVVWNGERCIGCGDAVKVCPSGALRDTGEGMAVDPAMCELCGACVAECPTEALEMLGRPWALDELVAEVVKDRAYFERSGGGVTVSGGEPAAQGRFVEFFLSRCQAAGLHTVLDTCGQCNTGTLLRLAARSHMVLFDLKLIDPLEHERHTGKGNRRILDNLLAVADDLAGRADGSLWIRTPLVPGVTATADNVRGIGEFIARLEPLARWELCAFNNLCLHKYDRLGRGWVFEGVPLMSRDQLDRLGEVARLCGVAPERVAVTGATRLEDR